MILLPVSRVKHIDYAEANWKVRMCNQAADIQVIGYKYIWKIHSNNRNEDYAQVL